MNFLIALVCVVIPIVGIGTAVRSYFKDKDTPAVKEDALSAMIPEEELKVENPNLVLTNDAELEFEEPTVEKLIRIIIDYLTTEGFRPKRDDYSVWFKSEGLNIEVRFTENDPHYFCLTSRFRYESEDYQNIVYLINEFLPQYKLAQAFVNNKSIGFSADTLIYGMHNVIPAFRRVFGIHAQIVDEFGKELTQLSAKNLN